MITTPKEYLDNLLKIQDANTPDVTFRLPSDELPYKIDLNKRTVETLKHVTVSGDHKAETIYFIADRYFDQVDLSETVCIIQYINAENKSAIYPVPFYDIQTEENKIIFPWLISGTATAAPGTIKFAIKFFSIKDKKLIFDLNTQPQAYKISFGMDLTEDVVEGDANATILQEFCERMDAFSRELQDKDLYWIEQ